MMNTFLKRRGGAGNGCWGGERSWSPQISAEHLALSKTQVIEWITFMQTRRRIHAPRAQHTHTPLHFLWLVIGDVLVLHSVWCVCRFALRAVRSERPSAATPVCTPWTHGCVVGFGSSEEMTAMAAPQKDSVKNERWQLGKKMGMNALLKLSPLRKSPPAVLRQQGNLTFTVRRQDKQRKRWCLVAFGKLRVNSLMLCYWGSILSHPPGPVLVSLLSLNYVKQY